MSLVIGKRYLPGGGASGQYIKIDTNGKPKWFNPNDSSVAHQANHRIGGSDALPAGSSSVAGLLQFADGGAAKRTQMPDGATAVYSQDAFATVDGWTSSVEAPTVSGGFLVCHGNTYKTIGSAGVFSGKTVILRVYAVTSIADFNIGTTSGIQYPFHQALVAGNTYTIAYRLPVNSDMVLTLRDVAGTGYFNIDFVWIGDYSYLAGSLSEEAARIADQIGDAPGVGVYASQTITATDLATAGKGDTIGGKKYTFVASLTASPGVEGEVLKGATKEDDLANESLAITEVSRANNGVKYWAAAVHPLVTSAVVGAVLTVTAKTKDGPENDITVVCESGTNHTAGGATLVGGCPDAGAKYSKLVAMGSQGLTAKTSLIAGDYIILLDSVVGFLKKKILVSNFFAADGGTTAYTAVQGNDSRLIKPPASWTPVPAFTSGADDGAFTVSNCKYVVTGKFVDIEGMITWTTKGTKTGSFYIGGLPVTVLSGTSLPIGTILFGVGGVGITKPCLLSGLGTNLYGVFQDTTASLAATDTNFSASTSIRFSARYITA